MPKYILLAGVNGAGKSTLFYMLRDMRDMARVNTDEIVREFGDWKNAADVLKAGRIAVKKLNQLIEAGATFNQETTLCGQTILRNIQRAGEKGYKIELHYVGVSSAEIAKERIRFRVKQGGHGIPEKDVERRYEESFENLRKIMPYCDLIVFYDNSESFRRFAILKKGKMVLRSKTVPDWFLAQVESKLETGTKDSF